MNDKVVSIRLPYALLEELNKKIAQGYFLDTSEAVRCIVRDQWLKYSQPELEEVKALRKDISLSLKKRGEKIAMREILKELQRIKKLVEDEEL